MLNKILLGEKLHAVADKWDNKGPNEVGDMETARKEFWEDVANEIIEHFKEFGRVPVNTTGTAAAQTGIGRIQ